MQHPVAVDHILLSNRIKRGSFTSRMFVIFDPGVIPAGRFTSFLLVVLHLEGRAKINPDN